jgi:hypothetical protein
MEPTVFGNTSFWTNQLYIRQEKATGKRPSQVLKLIIFLLGNIKFNSFGVKVALLTLFWKWVIFLHGHQGAAESEQPSNAAAACQSHEHADTDWPVAEYGPISRPRGLLFTLSHSKPFCLLTVLSIVLLTESQFERSPTGRYSIDVAITTTDYVVSANNTSYSHLPSRWGDPTDRSHHPESVSQRSGQTVRRGGALLAANRQCRPVDGIRH